MRPAVRTGIVGAAILAALAVLACGSALAYFTASGAGNASAGISKLAAPSPSATPALGGTVVLLWNAINPPGSGAVTYTVERDGGKVGGGCTGTIAGTTTCTDSGLGPGTHTYVVTAKWRSWTTSSSPASATIELGPLDHFSLSAESATPAVGEVDGLTIVAQDANGLTVTSYGGSHNITFSGASPAPDGTKPTVASKSGSATAFGKATSLSFDEGVAEASGAKNGAMKLYESGAVDIDASDGSVATAVPLHALATAGEATELGLTAASTAPVAGSADALSAIALDDYENVATSYAGPHALTFSGASASPNGTAPTVSSSTGAAVAFGAATTIAFSAGKASATGASNGAMTLYGSETAKVKASDGSISTPATLTVTVSPGTAAAFSLAAADTTPNAAANDNLTTTALDSYGNTATSYTGTHNITYSGAAGSPNGTSPTVTDSSGTAVEFGTATAIGFSSGVAKTSSSKNGRMKLYAGGPAGIGASDGTVSSATPLEVTVSPLAASRLAFAGTAIGTGSLSSPCLFTCTVTSLGNKGTVTGKVAVTDTYGNTVSGLGSGHATKVTTSGSGTVSGTPLTIPNSGVAESATSFTFTSKSNGNFTEALTLATSSGTTYTSATLTASR